MGSVSLLMAGAASEAGLVWLRATRRPSRPPGPAGPAPRAPSPPPPPPGVGWGGGLCSLLQGPRQAVVQGGVVGLDGS